MPDQLEDQLRNLPDAPLPPGAHGRIESAIREAERRAAPSMRWTRWAGAASVAAAIAIGALVASFTPPERDPPVLAASPDRSPQTLVVRYDLLTPTQPAPLRISDWSPQ